MKKSVCCVLLVCLAACGDDDAMDTGVDANPDTGCISDSQCDDGVYCNGAELCSSGSRIGGDDPCTGSFCDESASSCTEECPDADNDGQKDAACGGQDCDDSNPNRFAGNPEICDVDNVDEDCDPSTFGFRDNDGDNNASAACCNEEADGTMNCGSDCDDNVPNINPDAPEVCDEVDNDCDGSMDEGVIVELYLDEDGDGFGSEDAMATLGCAGADPNLASNNTDCNDNDPAINPGAGETCGNTIDDDCDPMTNDDGAEIDCYDDRDGDGFTVSTAVSLCATPNGNCPGTYRNEASMEPDCCDTDNSVNPNAIAELFVVPNNCGKFDYDCSEKIEKNVGNMCRDISEGIDCKDYHFLVESQCMGRSCNIDCGNTVPAGKCTPMGEACTSSVRTDLEQVIVGCR